MRKLSALMLVAAGFSQWSCGDDNPGAPLGPDTSWQVGCSEDSTDCGSIPSDAHGPLEGADPDAKDDDQKLKVTCTKDDSGLNITLTDPGNTAANSDVPARAAGVLKITRIVPGSNKCYVDLTDKIRSTGALLHVTDSCVNSNQNSDTPGSCTITGSMNTSNGYAFEGTLVCPDSYQAGTAVKDYRIGAGKDSGSPIQLQIVHCS